MNICVRKDIDWTPKEFEIVKKHYHVFYDNDTESVIGCGNILIKHIDDRLLIYIAFIEAYGGGRGRAIINYLLQSNTHVKLFGDSYPHASGFWRKMGATLDTLQNEMYPFSIEKIFVILTHEQSKTSSSLHLLYIYRIYHSN